MTHDRAVDPKVSDIESGEEGPCLTDAAHTAALDEPLVFGFAATLRSERIPQR